ncbi:MAG: hypothetical protein IMX01_09920, partial [Limnochordaceae bacterium]|nr:hypothetical protein [Limnochordaceae bacterium]
MLEAAQAAEVQGRKAQESLIRYSPEPAPGVPLQQQARLVQEILQSISTCEGGRISRLTLLLHPAWRRFVQAVRVAGHSPETAPEFQALQEALALALERENLQVQWDRLVAAEGGPGTEQLGPEPERAAAQFGPAIRECLDWADVQLRPALQKLQASCGFRWEAFLAVQPPELERYGELTRLVKAVTETFRPILAARIAALQWRELQARLTAWQRTVAEAAAAAAESTVVQQLNRSVADAAAGNPGEYRQAYQRLVRLRHLKQALQRRRELLDKLGEKAPSWAQAVRQRQGVHGLTDLPGDPEAAWIWRQLEQELNRRSSVSVEQLQADIARQTDRLREVTAQLVEATAWSSQIRRTTTEQKQALFGWLHTVRRIGKGFGKRTPELREEATRNMVRARKAVPVWIMPLARVFEQFDPREARFDVVIVDEASQSDITALAALYLGKQVIVVGDNEQVSPDAVGEQVERVEP